MYKIKQFLNLVYSKNSIFTLADKKQFHKAFTLMFLFSFIELIGIGLIVIFLLNLFNDEFFNYFNNLLINYFYISFQTKEYFLVTASLLILIKYIIQYLFVKIAHNKLRDMENSVINYTLTKYLNTNSYFLFNKNTNSLVREIVSDISILFNHYVKSVLEIVKEGLIIFFLISLVIFYSGFQIITAIFLLISISILITKFFESRATKLSKLRYNYREIFFNKLNEYFALLKEIRIKNISKLFIIDRSYEYKNLNLVENDERLMVYYLRFIFEIILIFTILLFAYLILFFFDNKSSLNIYDTLIITFLPLLRIFPSLVRINTFISKMNYQNSLVKNIINRARFINQNLIKKNLVKKTKSFEKIIKFENINFNYENQIIFKKSKFEIFKNKLHFIYGPSGSGKTTLIEIILGFKKINGVKIKCDNSNIKNIDNPVWRSLFSYVPQMINTVDGSLLENIFLTKKDLNKKDKKKLLDTIEISELTDVYKKLNSNIYKNISLYGKGLSGGQKQRIGIARALIDDREIIILDEPTAALDQKLAFKILNNLIKLNKTIIVISHNLKIMKYFDHIYKLEKKNLRKIK